MISKTYLEPSYRADAFYDCTSSAQSWRRFISKPSPALKTCFVNFSEQSMHELSDTRSHATRGVVHLSMSNWKILVKN